jgi:hypothetical protein
MRPAIPNPPRHGSGLSPAWASNRRRSPRKLTKNSSLPRMPFLKFQISHLQSSFLCSSLCLSAPSVLSVSGCPRRRLCAWVLASCTIDLDAIIDARLGYHPRQGPYTRTALRQNRASRINLSEIRRKHVLDSRRRTRRQAFVPSPARSGRSFCFMHLRLSKLCNPFICTTFCKTPGWVRLQLAAIFAQHEPTRLF